LDYSQGEAHSLAPELVTASPGFIIPAIPKRTVREPVNSIAAELAASLLKSPPSNSSRSDLGSQSEKMSVIDSDSQEDDSKWKEEWKLRLIGMQKKQEELKKKEETLQENKNGAVDKDWLLEELKRFRKSKAEDHEFLSMIYEMRNKLCDSELKSLGKTMKSAASFGDIVAISKNIIDSVITDVKKKAQEKENDMIRLVSDLLLENCKLRKVANEYAESINQGTVDKLEKYKKLLPVQGQMTIKRGDSISDNHISIWNHFPLFDFFNGWQDS